MKKSICVFASKNEKPDLYINIIGYCFAKFESKNIDRVYLFRIFDNPLERTSELFRIMCLKDNILTQLKALSNGHYLNWNWEENQFKNSGSPKLIEVDDNFKNTYKEILSAVIKLDIETKILLNDDVENEIERFVNDNRVDYIFDVTGVITRHLIRLSLSLLAHNQHIYSFEMNKKLTHSELDLIHNLSRTDFQYCLLNISRFSVSSESKRLNGAEGVYAKWLRQVADADIENVLEDMLSNSRVIKYKLDVVSLLSRFNDVKSRLNKQVIDQEVYNLEFSRINIATIELLKKINGS